MNSQHATETTTRRGFANTDIARHIILKERLTAEARPYIGAWLIQSANDAESAKGNALMAYSVRFEPRLTLAPRSP
jgi:hypothetical protein